MIKHSRACLTASAAILALVATPPLYAQAKGNDNGGGGQAAASQAQRGDAGGKATGSGKSESKAKPSNVRGAPDRGASAGPTQKGGAKPADGAGMARGNALKERMPGSSAKAIQDAGGSIVGGPLRNPGGKAKIGDAGGYAFREIRDTFGTRPRLIEGCPPGLAKKRNGCLPPGLAQNRYRGIEPGFFGLTGAESGRYLYEDGYLLRYRPDGVAGFLPLLGGALGIGNVWPASYQAAPIPAYYSDYFGLGDDRSYRYADNVIYRVDPQTSAITAIAGLLTGDDIAIGQPMPRGYDVYNVPLDYRDRYSDNQQVSYRYANGYVYEVDPVSSLVSSAIALVS